MPLITALESFVLGSALDLVAPPVMVSDVARDATPHLSAALDQTPVDASRATLGFDLGLRALLIGFRDLLNR
ncbi:hypothetical protein ACKI1J_18745 [Streptomyces scabiei]|uniref:hypothetical protein n=1 Tax=Streptomyces scabiei TaxID=1930 RepID=UPI0038F7EF6A